MPAPNNPLVCRVSIIGSRDTREIVNTFHVANNTPWTLTQMAQLATDTQNWINTSLKGMVPPQYSFNQISVRQYDPVTPQAYDLSISPPIVGTRGAVAEAGNVTVTMSLRTGLAGRKFRGRMYTPGIDESDVNTNDTIKSGLVAGLAAATQAFLTYLFTGTRAPVIFHKSSNTFTQIIGYAIENILDSQRRRLPGRGR